MSRIPLVALHGFMGSAATFGVLDGLSGREVVAMRITAPPSRPGEALSSTHDEVARDLLDSLRSRGVGRFDLLGYSMGGRIAMHMALLAPERVGMLILESAHPGIEAEEGRAARREHDATWADRLRLEWPDVLEAWYEQNVFDSLSPTLRQQLAAEKADMNPNMAAHMLEALSLGRQRPMWEEIAGFEGPSLFVSGEMDERYKQVGERLAALPGPIRHVTVKGAGHVVHREQPEAYLSALRHYLNQ